MDTVAEDIPSLIPLVLSAQGVRDVVLSPGARCAPVSVALDRYPGIRCRTVVSEHVAGFIALGIAIQTGQPVALVCTSGSALLNYAPALAEAYRRQVPLIVISADRAPQWIGQADSQTMIQPGALAGTVKKSLSCGNASTASETAWWVSRSLAECVIAATTPPCAPVHLNVHIDFRSLQLPEGYRPRQVEVVRAPQELPTAQARAIGRELAPPVKVAVVVGPMSPDKVLNQALAKLSHIPNVAIITELYANVHAPLACAVNEAVFADIPGEELEILKPDVILTVGGALVTDRLKRLLRSCKEANHWHIGYDAGMCDTFMLLSRRIELDPGLFMRQLASAMQPWRNDSGPDSFGQQWRTVVAGASRRLESRIARLPWGVLTAMDYMGRHWPKRANLHVSNGLSVRYAMMTMPAGVHRVECNRGVSGIDGCTSTAIGSAAVYDGLTILISGDMSAMHDIGGVATGLLPSPFRMVVMDNGGGNIFRCVASTRDYPETPELLCVEGDRADWAALARAAGADYCRVEDMESLQREWPQFIAPADKPKIMHVVADAETDAAIYRNLTTTKTSDRQ